MASRKLFYCEVLDIFASKIVQKEYLILISIFFIIYKGILYIFGCESSPISRNVRSLVSPLVSPLVRQMQNKAK